MGAFDDLVPSSSAFGDLVPPKINVAEETDKAGKGLQEGLMSLTSGIVATPIAGIAGLGAALSKFLGVTDTSGADVVNKVANALTYQPRTELGQRTAEILTYPLEKLQQGIHYVGNKAYEATDSPAVGAVVETGLNALPLALPLKFGRRVKSNQGRAFDDLVPKTEAEIPLPEAKVGAFDDLVPKQEIAAEAIQPIINSVQPVTPSKPTIKPKETLATDAQISYQETIDKANRFLDSDLSKIEIPAEGVNPGNYVNYLITSNDAKQAMLSAAEINKSQVDKATRGVVTHEQTEVLAQNLGLTSEELIKRRSGRAFNAEELEAAKSLMAAASENLSALANKVKNGSEADKALFYTQFEEFSKIQAQFLGARAEAGRALNILGKQTGPEIAKASALKKILEERAGNLGVDELADLVSSLDDPAQVAKFARDIYKPTKGQALIEIWKGASLLTSPRTHAVNVLSNLLTATTRIPERTIGAGLGKLHGGEKMYFREATAQAFGAIQGAIDGARLAAKTLIEGPTAETAAKAIDIGRINAFTGETFGLTGTTGKIADVVGEAGRLSFRFLGAEDEFFKSVASRMELNALATRQGIKEGKSGKLLNERVQELVNDPTPELQKAAKDFSLDSTFNKELGFYGKISSKFLQEYPVAQIIVPFLRTTLNIFKFTAERTPLALFSKSIREDIKNGGIARDNAIAKIMVGTGLSTWAAYQAFNGNITGGGPSDPDLKRSLLDVGWQPYSIKIFDKYYAYNRLEPVGTFFGVAADMVEINKAANEDEKAKIPTMIAASIAKNISSKFYLSGITDVVNVMSDPDRYGDRYINKLAGTVIPTGIADIARSEDPIIRDTQTALDAIKNRIPGKSQELLPRRNAFGEPLKSSEGGLSAFNPIKISKVKDDKVYQEITRLKVDIPLPQKQVFGVKLTPQQYDKYSSESGGVAKQALDTLVNKPEYDVLPDWAQRELIKKIVDGSRTAVRGELIPDIGTDAIVQEKLKRFK